MTYSSLPENSKFSSIFTCFIFKEVPFWAICRIFFTYTCFVFLHQMLRRTYVWYEGWSDYICVKWWWSECVWVKWRWGDCVCISVAPESITSAYIPCSRAGCLHSSRDNDLDGKSGRGGRAQEGLMIIFNVPTQVRCRITFISSPVSFSWDDFQNKLQRVRSHFRRGKECSVLKGLLAPEEPILPSSRVERILKPARVP